MSDLSLLIEKLLSAYKLKSEIIEDVSDKRKKLIMQIENLRYAHQEKHQTFQPISFDQLIKLPEWKRYEYMFSELKGYDDLLLNLLCR